MSNALRRWEPLFIFLIQASAEHSGVWGRDEHLADGLSVFRHKMWDLYFAVASEERHKHMKGVFRFMWIA